MVNKHIQPLRQVHVKYEKCHVKIAHTTTRVSALRFGLSLANLHKDMCTQQSGRDWEKLLRSLEYFVPFLCIS